MKKIWGGVLVVVWALSLLGVVVAADPAVWSVVASDSLLSDADAGKLFTVTVNFTEAMDTEKSPSVALAPDVSASLGFSGGVWIDADTYQASYVVVDADCEVDAVAVSVSGATSILGNAQQEYIPQSEFEIDTLNPTVALIAASPTRITCDDMGSEWLVTLGLAEDYCEDSHSLVCYPTTDAGGVIDYPHPSFWIWDVPGRVITFAWHIRGAMWRGDVGVKWYVEDCAGNWSVGKFLDLLHIDMYLASVRVSDPLITETDIGGSFVVTVEWDRPMNTAFPPTILFSPDVSATLHLDSGDWVDSTTYTATYTILGVEAHASGISVDVADAWCADGDPQPDYPPEREFGIDISCIPPSITAAPSDQVKTVWEAAVFTVTANGSGSLSYQWRKDGVEIPGAISSSYVIESVAMADAGSYDAVVTNPCGNVTSEAVDLKVERADPTIRVTPYNVIYDGLPHTAISMATGVFGEPLAGVDVSGTTHTERGDYPADSWAFVDVTGNYNSACGMVHDTIIGEFGGLMPPYQPQLVVKRGSVVPLRWQYTDVFGVALDSHTASPLINVYGPHEAPPADLGNAVAITLHDAGQSGMRYDTDANTWQYNWQTKNLGPGVYSIFINALGGWQPAGPIGIVLGR